MKFAILDGPTTSIDCWLRGTLLVKENNKELGNSLLTIDFTCLKVDSSLGPFKQELSDLTTW